MLSINSSIGLTKSLLRLKYSVTNIAAINIAKNINFYKNHPSTEHFLPLFIAYGNAINKKGKSFNKEMIYSNISMESFIFDEKETYN